MSFMPRKLLSQVCIYLLIIFWLFFVCSKRVAGYTYDDAHSFKVAAEFLNKGMYLETIGMYHEIANYSNNLNNRTKALLFIGTTYSLYLDQHETALNYYDNIIDNYPESQAADDALFNSGMVLYEKGNFKKAHALFKKYIEKYPRGRHLQSAEVWADQSKTLPGITIPQKIPPVKPDIPNIHDTSLRVLLRDKAGRILVTSDKITRVYDIFSKKIVYSGKGPVVFEKKGKHLTINGKKCNAKNFRIETNGATFKLDNRRYRGFLTISAEPYGLCAVNHIPVEQYLYGVVPKEMPHSWAKEALKAQAVAARTYSLYIKGKSSNKNYDVEATTASQVYSGYDAEKRGCNLVVDETKGQVMTFEGKLIIAYFHANSGGYTEDAGNVWGADIPYLKGIQDHFTENIKESTWEFFLSYDSATDRFNRYGLKLGWIKKLYPYGKSKSGRILKIKVVSDKGTHVLTGNNFRIKIGGTCIKSTLFQIKLTKYGILFKGKGYGHGVGMSQWGANRMAQAGYSYKEILKHYYQNINIVKVNL